MQHDLATQHGDRPSQLSGQREWIGAEITPEGVRFRVWAPKCQRVRVVSADEAAAEGAAVDIQRAWSAELERDKAGFFAGLVPDIADGCHYYFQLDEDPTLWPDPASRFQPHGPLGPSQVVDPARYAWLDAGWSGVKLKDAVIYELHIGTFTPEGNWQAAMGQLAELAALGITVLEVMPIAEFPGRFGWSYDPANMFAPSHLYGTPDDVRAFIDEAHRVGLAVILDVVYNHFGSVGEQIVRPFSADYFAREHETDWGTAINFDGPRSESVRAFFLDNVRLWIAEYHFDGLRIDATQAFRDTSDESILLAITRAARRAAAGRTVLVVGENEPQRASLLRPARQGGCELDALWNEDFHHAAMVRLTGQSEAYYSDYRGSAEEFVAMAQWGFLFQGQRYAWQKNPRGTPALDIAAPAFIHFLQNHDQLANSLRGARMHELASPGRLRALTAVLLLGPQTPMLFQGQEFAASSPFFYFNDCSVDDADGVRAGRAGFLRQFPSLASPGVQSQLVDPCDPATFRQSQLNLDERREHAETYALHRELLRLRREDPVIAERGTGRLAAASLTRDVFLWRFMTADDTRLLVVNLDRELRLTSVGQPLAAPPEGARWEILWSSEDPRYGGNGTRPLETDDGWHVPGESALLLSPVPQDEAK